MNPDMQNVIQKILNTQYQGSTRLLFLKSQVNELLAHFFAFLATESKATITDADRDKLLQAKDIIVNNISKPPSLSELSKLIGLNNHKLIKNFEELSGVPVFKYLQEERLNKAYELLCTSDKGVQETAWFVGYESLSSFSSAFQKKFGARPNQIKQQSLANNA